MFSSEKISNTNLRCLYKTDIVDNVEPSISVTLGKASKQPTTRDISTIIVVLPQETEET